MLFMACAEAGSHNLAENKHCLALIQTSSQALVQLSAMLQIAFGEAGSHIISHNIASLDKIDPMVPGRRVRGIFGFCDVRRFTDCTECFEAEVRSSFLFTRQGLIFQCHDGGLCSCVFFLSFFSKK